MKRADLGKRMVLDWLKLCAAGLCLLWAGALMAAEEAATAAPVASSGAHAVVGSTTEDLLALIREAQAYIDEDEDRFYAELRELLEPFIDFRNFARAVMGKHASSKLMTSLDEARRAELDLKIDRFSEVFAQGLIQTYGKGLLAFEGERIEVVPAESVDPAATKVPVKQLIYGDRPEPFEIIYSLRKYDSGEWKLRNVIIENINLGKVYRNQFGQSAKVYNGDIDRVIDQWSVVPAGD